MTNIKFFSNAALSVSDIFSLRCFFVVNASSVWDPHTIRGIGVSCFVARSTIVYKTVYGKRLIPVQ